EESGYRATKAKHVGRGCAVGNWVSKGGESYCFVKIDEKGEVTLSTAVMDTGPGAYTIMRQIVGEEIKVPLDSIKVEIVDTTKVAQVVEVEVDEETGEVNVKRVTTAHNTGTILNPLTHQGQIDGAVVMGFGYGTMEQIITDDGGKVLTANLGDYKIPSIKDI